VGSPRSNAGGNAEGADLPRRAAMPSAPPPQRASQDQAAALGIPQKLVFVTVDSIGLDSSAGVLGVTAKAWTVPK
jgi:hypothetical protein